MEKRSQKVKDIRAVYEEAPEIRENDKLYQEEVLKRWVQLLQNQQEETTEVEAIESAGGSDDTIIEGKVLQKETN